ARMARAPAASARRARRRRASGRRGRPRGTRSPSDRGPPSLFPRRCARGGLLISALLSRALPADPNAEHRYRLGVLAFGDSIPHGGGELQWGVALQSWAMWVARGLGLPLTNYAADGALVGDVLGEQMPALERRSAHGDARYELGCLYIGVNDVRAF